VVIANSNVVVAKYLQSNIRHPGKKKMWEP
jgi:hypothetical protein